MLECEFDFGLYWSTVKSADNTLCYFLCASPNSPMLQIKVISYIMLPCIYPFCRSSISSSFNVEVAVDQYVQKRN